MTWQHTLLLKASARPRRTVVTAVFLTGSLLAAAQPFNAACPPPEVAPQLARASLVGPATLTLARCVTADLDAGRWHAAERRLAQAQHAAIALPAEARVGWLAQIARLDAARLVDTGSWEFLAGEVIAHEDTLAWVGPLVRGVAAARSAWARQDPTWLQRAGESLDRLEALARQAGSLSEAEWARLIVQGSIAGAQYEREEMTLLLDAAHELQVRLLSGDDRRVPVVRAWELQADLLRLTDRYAAASERYRDGLVEAPRRVQARIGLAEAYRRLGYTRQADETLAQARALWSEADPEARDTIR